MSLRIPRGMILELEIGGSSTIYIIYVVQRLETSHAFVFAYIHMFPPISLYYYYLNHLLVNLLCSYTINFFMTFCASIAPQS